MTVTGKNTVQTDSTLGVSNGGIIASDGSTDGLASLGPGARQHAMTKGTTFTVMHDSVNTYAFVAEGMTAHGKPLVRKLYG